jgi:chromosomal replication initiation ATPase DnaA
MKDIKALRTQINDAVLNAIKKYQYNKKFSFVESELIKKKVERTVLSIEKVTGITFEQLQSPVRKRPIVFARHVYFYMMRNSGVNIELVGLITNNDHSTLVHGAKSLDTALMYDSDRATFEKIINEANKK